MKEKIIFPALLHLSNVNYLTTKGVFDFLEKDTMEVWVNGVVVETAVSSHYKKTLLWNKIDNDEEYKCTDVFVKSKSSWVQPRLAKIFPSLGYYFVSLHINK